MISGTGAACWSRQTFDKPNDGDVDEAANDWAADVCVYVFGGGDPDEKGCRGMCVLVCEMPLIQGKLSE